MDYRTRHAEKRLRLLADHAKVVLVVGARQVGKSTLLSHVFPSVPAVVFDPVQDLYGARRDPDLFLDSFPSPRILDEIQYVPQLLPALKRRVDRCEGPAQYFLSGSQNLAVLRSVAESMAGRVAILDLGGMSLAESSGEGSRSGWLGAYLEDPERLPESAGGVYERTGGLARTLWRGCLPGTLDLPDDVVPDIYRSYVQTYLDRDVRTMEDIRALTEFDRFLGLCGALTAQEINASKLGRDVGIAPSTARRWLDLLGHTYQWIELPPFHGSAVKRLSGKNKGMLQDTGLACHLQRISSPPALSVNPLLGSLFETWVAGDLHRRFSGLSVPPMAYHWRSAGGGEVDLLLERDGKYYPIEAKCKTTLQRRDTRGLRAFRETYPHLRIMAGAIVYAGSECHWVDDHTIAVPWNLRV